MIPYLLVIVGVFISLCGLAGLFKVALLPYQRLKKVVFEWEDDILKYSSGAGRQKYKRDIKQLTCLYIFFIILGVTSFFFGIYLGYAEKGSSFWFYKQLFGEEIQEEYWDSITEDNKFVSSSGNIYTYYIMVEGKTYSFCGESCKDVNELKDQLLKIRRENTVMIIDSFAISSAYHDAEDILKDLGIKYETEEK